MSRSEPELGATQGRPADREPVERVRARPAVERAFRRIVEVRSLPNLEFVPERATA